MKGFLLAVTLISISPMVSNGQNFVFLKEESFPCTESYTLKSNADTTFIKDLELLFAKDQSRSLIVVRSKLVSTVRIKGKLIIYLNDGTVITCVDKGMFDNVDDTAISVYHLTVEEIESMKKSNINTVRYEIKCEECFANPIYEGSYSASNTGKYLTDFTSIISDFF